MKRSLWLATVSSIVAATHVFGPAPAFAADPFEAVATIALPAGSSSDVVVSGNYAFVASNSTISVIDTSTNTIVRSVATGGVTTPRGSAAAGDRVFFAANGSDQLVTLDTSTWTVSTLSTNQIGNVCDAPFNLLVVSSSRLVANCHGTNPAIQVYDISGAPSIVGTVTTANSPRLMSSNGNLVYVPNINSSNMSVVDIDALTATTEPVQTTPNSTAFLGSKVYIANQGSDSVTVRDGTSPFGNEMTLALTGTAPQQIEPCSGKLFTANRISGDTNVIDPADNSVRTIALGGSTTHVMGVSGDYAYFLNFGNATVSSVDCANETLVATITVANGPDSIAFSREYAYVTSGDNTISVFTIPEVVAPSAGSDSSTNEVEELQLGDFDGVRCVTSSVSGQRGTWVTLPRRDQCSIEGDLAQDVLGWATIADFPVLIAQRQVDNGWGAYELFDATGRMTGVFIPAGGATLLSGSTRLFPVIADPVAIP